ncbi:MAG: 6-bladed beta-propeller [Thermomicrobiales bacterium]
MAAQLILIACGAEPNASAIIPTRTPTPAPTRVIVIPTVVPPPTPVVPVPLGPADVVGIIDTGASAPIGVTVDGRGNLFVVDVAPRIQKFGPDGRLVAAWGRQGSGDAEFLLTDAQINGNNIAADPEGNLYVPDTGNARIQKFDGNGRFLLAWGSRGNADGQFSFPHGVTVDASQRVVYVADTNNNRVQGFDTMGRFVAAWAAGTWTLVDVTADGVGNLSLVDVGGPTVQLRTANGQPLGAWGRYGSGNGQMVRPLSTAIDGQGTIFVADTGNHRVQRFDRGGRFLAQWGTQGRGIGQFQYPTGIAVDASGSVFVADMGNHRVQLFRVR